MKIWQLWAQKNRELPHTPTYTVQCECTRLQPVRSLHAQAHHVHCTETQGPARGATFRNKKDIIRPTHMTTHVLCCLALPIAAPQVLMACFEGRNSIRCGCKSMCVVIDCLISVAFTKLIFHLCINLFLFM